MAWISSPFKSGFSGYSYANGQAVTRESRRKATGREFAKPKIKHSFIVIVTNAGYRYETDALWMHCDTNPSGPVMSFYFTQVIQEQRSMHLFFTLLAKIAKIHLQMCWICTTNDLLLCPGSKTAVPQDQGSHP